MPPEFHDERSRVYVRGPNGAYGRVDPIGIEHYFGRFRAWVEAQNWPANTDVLLVTESAVYQYRIEAVAQTRVVKV